MSASFEITGTPDVRGFFPVLMTLTMSLSSEGTSEKPLRSKLISMILIASSRGTSALSRNAPGLSRLRERRCGLGRRRRLFRIIFVRILRDCRSCAAGLRDRRNLRNARTGQTQEQNRQKSIHGVNGGDDANRCAMQGQFASAIRLTRYSSSNRTDV